ncbi:MAG: FliA/WhiG family RNA polymerase sigma factor [Planctomycetota bacterium]|nr:FliA/WhiG family RNA polymerase sigma factor [Planctomycetota bacterium]
MSDSYAMEGAMSSDRDQLILEHIPLLKHIAGRMNFDSNGSIDGDDLYGFGMLGLIAAADSWDVSRGLKFSTFAYPRIRGAILDELRRNDLLSRGRREKVRLLSGAVARLEQAQGVPPQPEQLAEELDMTLDEVDAIMVSASQAVETTLTGEDGNMLDSLLSDPRADDPVDSAEWKEMKTILVKVIEDLPPQEKSVIALYYADGLLLREIAQVMEVTESRVSQIHSRALYRLNRDLTLRTNGDPNNQTEESLWTDS